MRTRTKRQGREPPPRTLALRAHGSASTVRARLRRTKRKKRTRRTTMRTREMASAAGKGSARASTGASSALARAATASYCPCVDENGEDARSRGRRRRGDRGVDRRDAPVAETPAVGERLRVSDEVAELAHDGPLPDGVIAAQGVPEPARSGEGVHLSGSRSRRWSRSERQPASPSLRPPGHRSWARTSRPERKDTMRAQASGLRRSNPGAGAVTSSATALIVSSSRTAAFAGSSARENSRLRGRRHGATGRRRAEGRRTRGGCRRSGWSSGPVHSRPPPAWPLTHTL